MSWLFHFGPPDAEYLQVDRHFSARADVRFWLSRRAKHLSMPAASLQCILGAQPRIDACHSTTIVNGAVTGAIVGFLRWCTADFTQYGVTNINNRSATIADPLLELVRGAITGAVLAVLVPKLA
jgi:hypothetical protein